jgi:hypothetical protein
MFHAVLFAASSHLDVIRREQDNPITHYHRRHTVQLLLGSISNSGKVPSTSIAATMYLWHYEVGDHRIQLYWLQHESTANYQKSMNCHVEEAEIHKKGLQQMVEASGGLEKLGFGGFLAHLITL